jgi:valyl-tRNA synthetase
MTTELAPQYDPKAVETRIYAQWLDARAFHAVPDDRPPERRFSIVIPPPNVTGALHLGHAINGTVQDVLIRYHRMKGDNTLWMPGTDHAGIATQAVVEKRLFEEEKKTRHDLGKQGLVQRIWQWKDEYQTRIISQLKLIGSSCDWDRTRFTLDDQCAGAVHEAFFKLVKDGLIFRGLRLVNWDTQLQTAVADDEIYYETVQGQLTSIRYPVVERRAGEPEFLIVATTRPETMLGDTAVAVHPDDSRYNKLIGRQVMVPLVGRKIPIIADGLLVDPKFGTGVVKVTPAHDPSDYATGQRHGLQRINLLTPDGKVNGSGKGTFGGKDYDYTGLKFATAARQKVLEDLESLGLIVEKKPHEHEVGHSDRSKTPIEPYLSEQWFVKMGDVKGGITLADGRKTSGLAQAAIDALRDGRVKITPERYAKGYIDWLSQKRDWCISRQLWWGHPIPVWTVKTDRPTGEDTRKELDGLKQAFLAYDIALLAHQSNFDSSFQIAMAPKTSAAQKLIAEVFRCYRQSQLSPEDRSFTTWHPDVIRLVLALGGVGAIPGTEVLDTWFSSALWPLSTMGWPAQGTSDQDQDQLLPYFYPTSVLSTAREILSLWVARMVMFGLYLHGDVPFKQVYIHAVIQDGQGRPMKKSLGNGVDPVDIVDSHGADALRYTLASMITDTQDIRLPVVKDKTTGRNTSPRFDAGRNFANKIWNASRFILSNTADVAVPTTEEIIALIPNVDIADRWILARLNYTVGLVDESINYFRFAPLAAALYEFLWNDLCDWYLEIAKNRLRQKDRVVQSILLYCLDNSLRLLHPLMPFISEAIWEKLPQRAGPVITAPFPRVIPQLAAPQAEGQLALVQVITRKIRDIRNQYNVDAKKTLAVTLQPATAEIQLLLEAGRGIVEPLSGSVLTIAVDAPKPADAAVAIVPDVRIFVAGVIDPEVEMQRLAKRRAELERFIAGNRAKLANEAFVSKAPAKVVEGLKAQLAEQESELAAIAGGGE